MRYFIDTEFIERGANHPLELISIGVVAEDGREFYAISTEFEPRHANAFVKEHVIPHVDFRGEPGISSGGSPRRNWERSRRMALADIARELVEFVGESPEFWGDYAAYDWVVLCQLFGDMSGLPEGWPMFCRDLQQLRTERGSPELPPAPNPAGIVHHALYDARETAYQYRWLQEEEAP
jgi:hypothetical protein